MTRRKSAIYNKVLPSQSTHVLGKSEHDTRPFCRLCNERVEPPDMQDFSSSDILNPGLTANLPGKRLPKKVFVVHLKEIQIKSELRLGGSMGK